MVVVVEGLEGEELVEVEEVRPHTHRRTQMSPTLLELSGWLCFGYIQRQDCSAGSSSPISLRGCLTLQPFLHLSAPLGDLSSGLQSLHVSDGRSGEREPKVSPPLITEVL